MKAAKTRKNKKIIELVNGFASQSAIDVAKRKPISIYYELNRIEVKAWKKQRDPFKERKPRMDNFYYSILVSDLEDDIEEGETVSDLEDASTAHGGILVHKRKRGRSARGPPKKLQKTHSSVFTSEQSAEYSPRPKSVHLPLMQGAA